MSLFRTKSIAEIERSLHDDVADETPHLRRTLGSFDLVMLGIGAVIGAGIFATLGTAAVGEPGVRLGDHQRCRPFRNIADRFDPEWCRQDEPRGLRPPGRS